MTARRLGAAVTASLAALVFAATAVHADNHQPPVPVVPTPPPSGNASPAPAQSSSPGSSDPAASSPTNTAPPAPAQSSSSGSSDPAASSPATPANASPDPSGSSSDTSDGRVHRMINGWFAGIVTKGLTFSTDKMSSVVLQASDVTGLDVVRSNWTTFAYLAGGLFVLILSMVAVVVMTHDTVQTRYGIKELLPPTLMGFVGCLASLTIVSLGVVATNAFCQRLVSGSDLVNQTSASLTSTVNTAAKGADIFTVLLALVIVIITLLVVIEGVLRFVVLSAVTVAGPLALLFHAVPATDRIARLWWRLLGACLGIPIAQAVLFVLGVKYFAAGADQSAALHSTHAANSGTALLLSLVMFALLLMVPVIAYKLVFAEGFQGYRPKVLIHSLTHRGAAA